MEGLDHPQIQRGGLAITLRDPDLGPVRQIGPIADFQSTPSRITRGAPALGSVSGPLRAGAQPRDRGKSLEHPLAGITIVELGYFYAMPFALTLAASLGARVIKLEGREGDPMRVAFGAPESGAIKVMEGKQSLCIDLSRSPGQQIAQRLIARAHAFVLGFRPGVAERLHLDHATLAARNPRLVYVHATAYGLDGPSAHRPLYASAASAVTGGYQRQSSYWMEPERSAGFSPLELREVIAPRLRSLADGDANAALAVFSSLMLGLLHQSRAGEGQLLATSMIGGNAYAYSDDFNDYPGKPTLSAADPDQYGLHALYRLYETAAGWIFLAATDEREWRRLGAALDRADLLADRRFVGAAARTLHDAALASVLAGIFSTRGAAEWEQRLGATGVGCAQVFEGGMSAFTCTDPVLRETGLVAEVDDPTFGRVVRHGLPVALSETPGRVAAGCLRGQHTRTILSELGHSPGEIEFLIADSVVFEGGPDAAHAP